MGGGDAAAAEPAEPACGRPVGLGVRDLQLPGAAGQASFQDPPAERSGRLVGVPGFEAITWHGVVVPRATPRAVVDRLNADIVKALGARDLRERLESLGAELAPGTPQDFADYIAREIPKWAKVVKDSGARAE